MKQFLWEITRLHHHTIEKSVCITWIWAFPRSAQMSETRGKYCSLSREEESKEVGQLCMVKIITKLFTVNICVTIFCCHLWKSTKQFIVKTIPHTKKPFLSEFFNISMYPLQQGIKNCQATWENLIKNMSIISQKKRIQCINLAMAGSIKLTTKTLESHFGN